MAHPTIEEWLKTAEGRPMDPDGAYGYQCVDLVDQYAQDIFGIKWQTSVGPVASARQLLDAVPDAYWWRIDNNPNKPYQIPQRGDIVVWAGDAANPHGHTALVLSADQNGVTVLQQNGNQNWRPAHSAWLGYYNWGTGHIAGWLRPKTDKLKKSVVTKVKVEKGDTVTSIAKQFYTTVAAIQKANPKLNIDKIRVGQILKLR